jgi:hypothetical protein
MSGHVTGAPRVLLRLEGLVVFGAAIAGFSRFVANDAWDWMWFTALFLIPDLSMLGYLAGRKAGAALYNLGHWYGGPFVLLAGGVIGGNDTVLGIGLIWAGHIGFDRAMGYGLKYAGGFGATHLKTRGKKACRNETGAQSTFQEAGA